MVRLKFVGLGAGIRKPVLALVVELKYPDGRNGVPEVVELQKGPAAEAKGCGGLRDPETGKDTSLVLGGVEFAPLTLDCTSAGHTQKSILILTVASSRSDSPLDFKGRIEDKGAAMEVFRVEPLAMRANS